MEKLERQSDFQCEQNRIDAAELFALKLALNCMIFNERKKAEQKCRDWERKTGKDGWSEDYPNHHFDFVKKLELLKKETSVRTGDGDNELIKRVLDIEKRSDGEFLTKMVNELDKGDV